MYHSCSGFNACPPACLLISITLIILFMAFPGNKINNKVKENFTFRVLKQFVAKHARVYFYLSKSESIFYTVFLSLSLKTFIDKIDFN